LTMTEVPTFETFLQSCYCDLLMYYNGIGNA
jgi:hypothetical protein